MAEIYLDNNATTRPLPAVIAAMSSVFCDGFGNPSSVHQAGSRTRIQLNEAREKIAKLINGKSSNTIFTSGCTEANNWVLFSTFRKNIHRKKIITSAVEHSSVLAAAKSLIRFGADVVSLPVNSEGLVNPDDLNSYIDDQTALVSIQWVNNETGVIQPINDLGRICQSAGVPFHSDAAQALGKLNVSVETLPIDFMTFTGHKIHAPQGIGAVYAKNLDTLKPLFFGGDQEQALRPGTENLIGAVGFGAASEIRSSFFADKVAYLTCLRDTFECLLKEKIPFIKINAVNAPRVCNTTNVLFQDIDGQALIARLDQAGIRCSQSSACTNQRPEPSYVLESMGLSEEEAYSSVRFSFSELNTMTEVEAAVKKIKNECEAIKCFSNRASTYRGY